MVLQPCLVLLLLGVLGGHNKTGDIAKQNNRVDESSRYFSPTLVNQSMFKVQKSTITYFIDGLFDDINKGTQLRSVRNQALSLFWQRGGTYQYHYELYWYTYR